MSISKSLGIKLAAIAVGIVALGWFIFQAEWGSVASAFKELGWNAGWMLIPYLIVYGWDTLGWYITLTPMIRAKIGYFEAFLIRWAGESVNNLLPTAYVGGEAVKALMIQRRGGSIADATTAAVVSKTTQTIAEVIFIAATSWLAGDFLAEDSPFRTAMWWVAFLAALVAAALFGIQFLGALRWIVALLQKKMERWISASHQIWGQIQKLDEQLGAFYRTRHRDTWLSVLFFLLGWMFGAFEILLMARLLEMQLTLAQALALEAFIGVAKGLGIFVPGAIGVQESGIVFLSRIFAAPEGFGTIYATFRRARELVYAGLGMVLLGRMPRWTRSAGQTPAES